jgi:hypothetical protein
MADNYKSLFSPVAFLGFIAPAMFFLLWLILGSPIYPWDACWYRDIVERGYSFDGDITRQQNVAFLPGYPAIMIIFKLLLPFEVFTVQQIVSFLGYFVGALCFYSFLSERIGSLQSAFVVFLWSIMPFSIYFMNGYSECLYFALTGLTFYLLQRNRISLACLVISYGLITRPHTLALIPVCFYYIYRLESARTKTTFLPSLWHAGLRLLELSPLILILPIILTIYWYFKFGDSLVYRSALFAWHTIDLPPLISDFPSIKIALLKLFNGLGYSFYTIYKFDIATIDPSCMALVIFVLSVLFSVLFLFLRHYDVFIYHIVLSLFIMATPGTMVNLGRHACGMFSLPFAVVMFLSRLNKICDNLPEGFFRKCFALIGIGMAYLLVCLLVNAMFIHFIWYAIRYLNGVWVS